MKYRDMLIAKFGVKEKTVASKAKTLGQSGKKKKLTNVSKIGKKNDNLE